MKAWKWLTALAVVGAVSMAVTACGGDDSGGSNSTPTPGGATTHATQTPGGSAAATKVTVTATDFAFDKTGFTVAAGETIDFTVKNNGSATHTFTVYKDDAYKNATDVDVRVAAGASKPGSGTLEAGEYYFRCEIHPSRMQGEFKAE